MAGRPRLHNHFYPLLPCGRRHRLVAAAFVPNPFLPTPAVRQETAVLYQASPATSIFLPTPAVRQETFRACGGAFRHRISTHSCRAAGDYFTRQPLYAVSYFYPLLPCGRRPFNIVLKG